jgi:hypothetical protein
MNPLVRWFVEQVVGGRLPDPRSGEGLVIYGIFGLAIGLALGVAL